MYIYRLYNKDLEFVKECFASSYDEAKRLLSALPLDKVFAVEKDGHEIECGIAWIKDMLDGVEIQ